MKTKLVLVAVLVLLAGCNGFLGSENQQSPNLNTSVEKSTDTTSSGAFDSDTQLYRINTQKAPAEGYELFRNTTSRDTSTVNLATVIRVHQSAWGATANATEGSNVVQSTVILVESQTEMTSAKEELLDSYAPEIESTTDGEVTTRKYTSEEGYKSTISVVTHQNILIYSIEFGGGEYYSGLAQSNTRKLLESAETYQNKE